MKFKNYGRFLIIDETGTDAIGICDGDDESVFIYWLKDGSGEYKCGTVFDFLSEVMLVHQVVQREVMNGTFDHNKHWHKSDFNQLVMQMHSDYENQKKEYEAIIENDDKLLINTSLYNEWIMGINNCLNNLNEVLRTLEQLLKMQNI